MIGGCCLEIGGAERQCLQCDHTWRIKHRCQLERLTHELSVSLHHHPTHIAADNLKKQQAENRLLRIGPANGGHWKVIE